MLTSSLTSVKQLLRKPPTTSFYRFRHLEGLFGTMNIQHGNNKPKSLHKTRRIWLPNVQRVSLFSELLQEKFKIRLTTRVLRTIDKKGGLDNYLLQTKDKNINSQYGLDLKARLIQQQKQQKQELK